MNQHSTAVKKLKKTLGRGKISFSAESRTVYATDVTRRRVLPACVVFVDTMEDVRQTVEIARSFGVPIVPRGAGTGMSGGAVPVRDCIVISFERMNRILSLDAERRLAVVEPGVITSKLQEEAATQGLFYPPDPSSNKFSSIGGNIAENAGGLRCVKYGVTSDYVAGVQFIDGQGRLVNTGVFREGGSSGIDLTQLLCGSEGTLGIVVKAALRLVPAPAGRMTLAMEFPSAVKAAGAVTAILNRGITPAILEFINQQTLTAITEYIPLELAAETRSVLLMEFDEPEERNRELSEQASQTAAEYQVLRVRQAESEEEREKLWKLRKSISPSLMRLADGKINEDIAVPRGRLAEFVEFTESFSKEIGIPLPVYGHAGDGNVHVNLMYNTKDEKQTEIAHRGVEPVLRKAVELGGTISGEHGIGLTKRDYLHIQFGEGLMAFHRELKRIFDPEKILNPGKILSD